MWHDECISLSGVFTSQFVIANLVACAFNLLTLHGGYRVESGRVATDRELLTLVASFTPFVLSFVPSVVLLTESYSLQGVLSLSATFVVWSGYGANAIANMHDTETKAAFYSVLDVVSKNLWALVVSVQVLATRSGESSNCA